MCTTLMATYNYYDDGHRLKTLTEQEKESLKKDKDCVSEFKRTKLENDAKKNWDLFYKRNSTNFFKDRHWISRECPEINQLIKDSRIDSGERGQPCLLEVGCGVGNALFPLIEENGHNMFIYGCDFSPNAIQFLKSHSLYNEDICKAFVCDVTQDDSLTNDIIPSTIDIAFLIFVLSAISPDKMKTVLLNIAKILKPGGLVFFRDYGLYDHAMLRFSRGHKISENFYVRQDGTRAYYFSEEEIAQLFSSSGYTILENSYIERETVNHKEGVSVKRIFVQGKFKII